MTEPTNTPAGVYFASLPAAELLRPAGYAPEFLRSVLRADALRPLFVGGTSARERLQIIRQAAAVSVELALSLGISSTLFCDPVRRFAPALWNGRLAAGFMADGWLGGMMTTEPGCGTDMRACATRCRSTAGGYELEGTKHWAGLTGLADYWLVLARDDEDRAGVGFPSLNFYVCRADAESFKVVKRYASAGLRAIPYGMSELRVRNGILGPLLAGSRTERFRLIHGILHRSRISIAAITAGACARMADDVAGHVRQRRVFGKALAEFGQARVRAAEVESAREIAAVLEHVAGVEIEAAEAESRDVDGLAANIVKVVATDLAFAAATSASQLLGGESYRVDTYIGRATADLRPFRIFEGSNDVLCDAIWQATEKAGRTGGESFEQVVTESCARAGLPHPATAPFKLRGPDGAAPQGLRCLGGRILANAAALRWALDRGLEVDRCRPLAARMAGDLHEAAAWGTVAGLSEY